MTFSLAARCHLPRRSAVPRPPPFPGSMTPRPPTHPLTRPRPLGHLRPSRPARFLFFTNECVGLGHMRRTLTLAGAVTERDPDASALVLTGAPIAPGLQLPARVDTVKLPMLARDPVHGLG